MTRTTLVLLLTGLLVVSGAQAGTSGPSAPVSTTRPPIVGVNYHPMWADMTAERRSAVLAALQRAGTQWVRIDVAWGTLQPRDRASFDPAGVAMLDRRIREIRAHGMKILLMFYWPPAWSSGTEARNGRPGNPSDYATAAAWVAERYDGLVSPDLRVDAMELWNEPDLDAFWDSSPRDTRVSDFARLIRVAGPAVRRANPSMTVVVGGPASVDVAWYRSFYRNPGVIGTYDAIAVHPYPSLGDAPPERAGSDNAGSMTSLPRLSGLMERVGDTADIWATEFGWSTHADRIGSAPWRRGVGRARQARFLVRASALMSSYPRVEAAFWYNARDTWTGDRHLDGFGLLDRRNRAKPAYHAFRCVAGGQCP